VNPAGKRSGQDKDFLEQLERFFDSKVEPKLRNGFRELEKVLKKEIRIRKLEEIEQLLKKEIKLGKLKDSDLLRYDPESPFSYLSAFIRDKAVASVAPSTKYVVKKVLKAMAVDKARLAVEFGPAEGVITRKILQKLPKDGILVGIERNENFAKAVERIRDDRLRVVCADVQEIDVILEDLGLSKPDVIVSGIPFSYFEPIQRHELLRKISSLLSPRGRFVAYQFTTHLIPLLKLYFKQIDTQFEIRNLPPHFIFTCRK